MPRYIDADAVTNAMQEKINAFECQGLDNNAKAYSRVLKFIKQQPTADVAEVEKAMEWLEGYTFADEKQVYTNGTVLVPLFRVKQAFLDKAYNGLMDGR